MCIRDRRYVLDEAKEYMAGYYFFISKKNGKLFIKKLQDLSLIHI